MRCCFIIVVFNTTKFLEKQIELINRFYSYDIIVIDNSLDLNYCDKIRYIATKNNCEYVKTLIKEGDASRSHGDACNIAYALFESEYDIMVFLDHDCFPVAELDIVSYMNGRNIAGVTHVKDDVKYFWAGFTIINNTLVDPDSIDFSPCPGLDTGGSMHHLINDTSGHIPQRQIYKDMGVDFYNFYDDIADGKFIHFINGSNWNKESEEQYDNRIEELFKLLP